MKKIDKTSDNTLASERYIHYNNRIILKSTLSKVISDIGIEKTKVLLFDFILSGHLNVDDDNRANIKSFLEEMENYSEDGDLE